MIRTFPWRAAALTAALLVAPAAADAHDPGLSSADVAIGPARIVATVSLAAADAQLFTAAGRPLESMLESMEIRVDDVVLSREQAPVVTWSDTGVVLTASYEGRPGSRLTVRPAIPAALSRGHRQLLTVRGRDGLVLSERMLDRSSNAIEVAVHERARSRTAIAGQFLALGLTHILAGYDHLLFLGALLIAVRRVRDLITTVTAFTVAHSLTLAAAVLGLVHVPAAIVEPMIAASIVFVGVENLARRQVDSRWKLTFVFGLIHGLGFAGALQDVMKGESGGFLVTALAAFNAGVETGQVVVALALWPISRYLNGQTPLRVRLMPACSVAVVCIGVYWFVERTWF